MRSTFFRVNLCYMIFKTILNSQHLIVTLESKCTGIRVEKGTYDLNNQKFSSGKDPRAQ